MKVEIQEKDQMMVAQLAGRLDTAVSQEVSTQLQPLVDNADKTLVLDCKELEYISSSGLRILQKTMRSVMMKKGKFIIINVNPDIFKVLQMTGFTKFMTIEQKA